MEKKQISLEAPVVVSGLTLIPVTRTSIYTRKNRDAINFFGLKNPLYILVLDQQSRTRVFTITGEETSLERLAANYPELEEVLRKTPGFSGVYCQPWPEGPPQTLNDRY